MAESKKSSEAFSAEEKAAMRERAREQKAQATKAEAAQTVLDTIAALTGKDRELGEGIYALVMKTAPNLDPKNYYGMPAFYRDGKVVCFFQPASKFKVRYATFGFEMSAQLDDGDSWPVAFAVTELTAAVEAKFTALVKKAVG